jgi:hypothetical protein
MPHDQGLDAAFAPGPIRPSDVFEKITGRSGIHATYPLGEKPTRAQRQGAKAREATLMIRHVSRDKDKIARHLVREVRDEDATRLSYDAHLATCTFYRDPNAKAAPGRTSVRRRTPRRGAACGPAGRPCRPSRRAVRDVRWGGPGNPAETETETTRHAER